MPRARCLRALYHHEHDGHAVHGVQDGREPLRIRHHEERQQQKRRDDEREHHAVGAHHVHAQVLELPQHQHRDRRHERAGHGQHVHQRSHLRFADGQRAHDARAEPERSHAERAAPVVAHHGAVHVRVVARHVLEHGLVAVDLAAFQNNGQAEQRQEHKRYEVGRHRLRYEVQREVHDGRIGRAHDEVAVAVVGIEAGEQPLPQHEEPGRTQSQQAAAYHHERKGPGVQVDGRNEATPAKEVRRGGQHDHEAPRGPGQEVHAEGAGEVACREHERLRQEEPEHDLGRLELQGQERKHASPYAGGIDGQEQRVAERRDVRLQYADDGCWLQRAPPGFIGHATRDRSAV